MLAKDPLLTAKQLAFQYPREANPSRENGWDSGPSAIALDIQTGEMILMSGPSGCGKSTLARCLTGIIPHLYRGTMQGEVRIAGQLTTETPLWQLSELAGLVFQDPAGQMLAHSVETEILFGLENLGLVPSEMKRRLDETLERFSLAEMRQRPPQSLSGGEQQKLALAAITARQPPMLVLDEPLSMLDSTTATELIGHLEDLSRQGTTVLICEHRAEYLDHLPRLRRIPLNGRGPTELGVPQEFASLKAPLLEKVELCVDDLSVNLGGQDVLQRISFASDGGEVIAIVGRNGAGKTTLLRSLAGLQKHRGQITLNGERPQLGLVLQNANLQLFNGSVRQEILYGLKDPDLDLYRGLLQMLGLTRYEETPPLLLSEGEKKRVALATVLARQPFHGVLLDEPALGQDTAHKGILLNLTRELAHHGRLVIMTTHDLVLASQADRLLLLAPDGIVADGPPSQVLQNQGAWRQIGMQVPDWVGAKVDD